MLEHTNLLIREGSFVGIKGPSGGGKSTLLKLILGLYEPDSGEISVGGRVLADADWPAWRRTLGVVGVDDRLFAGTVAENIHLFETNSDADLVAEVASMAQLHSEILGMPMGYDTLAGDLAESMSAGQKQRLLLARALYRRPSVLVLDEGTASLDAENEKRITEVIRALPMTRLVVAHRPALLDAADTLYEIEAGTLSLARDASDSPRLNANP